MRRYEQEDSRAGRPWPLGAPGGDVAGLGGGDRGPSEGQEEGHPVYLPKTDENVGDLADVLLQRDPRPRGGRAGRRAGQHRLGPRRRRPTAAALS